MLRNVLASFRRKINNTVSVLAKEFVGVLVGEWEVNDDIITTLPVSRCGNLVVAGKLERVNDTNNFIKVTASGGRIGHHQGNGLVWFENKDRTNRHWHASGVLVSFVQDTQAKRMFAGWIAKERKCNFTASVGLDILNPCFVRRGVVARETAELDAASGKLASKLGGGPKFGGAYWSEITRVHKDAAPRVAEILIEIKIVRILGRALKIWELQVSSVTQREQNMYMFRV